MNNASLENILNQALTDEIKARDLLHKADRALAGVKAAVPDVVEDSAEAAGPPGPDLWRHLLSPKRIKR